MWQELRTELHPLGVEVVTVGLDTAGAEACRPFIEAARPQHPSLVDTSHVLAEKLGVLNIPNSVWIDEGGTIVRPAEPAPVQRPARSRPRSDRPLPSRIAAIFEEASHIRIEPERYVAALRDWAARGADSPYALPPEEVVARSHPRSADEARAAAHFELATSLWRAGHGDDAVAHFREAHRLHPSNLAYKRQAWSLVPSAEGRFARYWQGPAEGAEAEWPYEGDWLSEVREMGAENYYPPLQL